MKKNESLVAYLLRLGDNAMVLGQRLTEIVAAGPELEEELANANIALDYLGQARMFYSYAGELEGKGRGEDDLRSCGRSVNSGICCWSSSPTATSAIRSRARCYSIFFICSSSKRCRVAVMTDWPKSLRNP